MSKPRLVIEHVYTRDARIPLILGDHDLTHGWRCIPIPPALDEGWEIFDTKPDRKTGWRRVRVVRGPA
jgi:hypothetical protein